MAIFNIDKMSFKDIKLFSEKINYNNNMDDFILVHEDKLYLMKKKC